MRVFPLIWSGVGLLGLLGMFYCYGPSSSNILEVQSGRVDKLTEKSFPKEYQEWSDFDPGYDKWLVSFAKIIGSPPYTLLKKRLFAKDSNAFQPVAGMDSMAISEAKKTNRGIYLCLSAKGFMPGEKVTLRLQSKEKDVFTDVSCYPRPLTMQKPTGEIVLEAELTNVDPTIYHLKISAVGLDEKFDFISTSAHEKMNYPMQGPVEAMSYMPGVTGRKGGVAKIELRFKDGVAYTLDLPWGNKLVKYTETPVGRSSTI
jgi:hypothetical protein